MGILVSFAIVVYCYLANIKVGESVAIHKRGACGIHFFSIFFSKKHDESQRVRHKVLQYERVQYGLLCSFIRSFLGEHECYF